MPFRVITRSSDHLTSVAALPAQQALHLHFCNARKEKRDQITLPKTTLQASKGNLSENPEKVEVSR